MKAPIKVTIQHPNRTKLNEPFQVKFTVQNTSEEVFPVQVTYGAENWAMPRGNVPSYLIAGELLTNIDLMPLSDSYTFAYTIVPLKLGIQNLPQFSISRRINLKQNIDKQEAMR